MQARTSKGFGKRDNQSSVTTTATGNFIYSAFFVQDGHSGRRFLVDTEAEVSVLPTSPHDKHSNSHTRPLTAANGTTISTYGKQKK